MALLGFISVVGGVINLFKNWRKDSKISQHEAQLQNHEIRLEKLENTTKEQDSFIKVLCTSILAIVSHEINGNSIDKLTEAKDKLEKFLINK